VTESVRWIALDHVESCCDRDHVRLEQEKLQTESDIKSRGAEMVALQRELESLVAAAKKLDSQRTDAKKQLDELDKKVVHLTSLCIE